MREWIDLTSKMFEHEYHFPMKMAVLIAAEIGAYENMLQPGTDLEWEDGFGKSGAVLTMPDESRIFIDAAIRDDVIYLSQIAIENKSQGLGRKVMNAIATIAKRYKYGVCIRPFANPNFFAAIPWLQKNNEGAFVADFRQH